MFVSISVRTPATFATERGVPSGFSMSLFRRRTTVEARVSGLGRIRGAKRWGVEERQERGEPLGVAAVRGRRDAEPVLEVWGDLSDRLGALRGRGVVAAGVLIGSGAY